MREPPEISSWSKPDPGQRVFTNHESRDTKHGFYVFFTSHGLNASCLGATAVPPAWVLGSRITRHETRITAFMLSTIHCLYGSQAVKHFSWSKPAPHPWFSRVTRHETRITAFSSHRLNASCRGATAVPPASVFGSRNTRHETRITAFYSSTNQDASGKTPPCGSKPAPRPPRCSAASSCCGSREVSPRKAASHASRRSLSAPPRTPATSR